MNLRQASPADRSVIDDLISDSSRSHLHLDWLDPISLTGKEPFILASEGEYPAGVLGCPPDLPGIAWIRAFASADGYDAQELWNALWDEGAPQLLRQNVERVAAIALEDWFAEILSTSGFTRTNSVIFYELELESGKFVSNGASHSLRPIRSTDVTGILELDRSAFEPIWRLSSEALSIALIQASSASLVEGNGTVLGYQITTSSPFGAHLARLAVLPSHQREGLGTALVNDAIESVQEYGLDQLSVNTQENNTSSRKLYEKLGFQATEKAFPVFEIEL